MFSILFPISNCNYFCRNGSRRVPSQQTAIVHEIDGVFRTSWVSALLKTVHCSPRAMLRLAISNSTALDNALLTETSQLRCRCLRLSRTEVRDETTTVDPFPFKKLRVLGDTTAGASAPCKCAPLTVEEGDAAVALPSTRAQTVSQAHARAAGLVTRMSKTTHTRFPPRLSFHPSLHARDE